MAESNSISRDEVLSGRFSIERRASRVLSHIEARVAHMRIETRQAVRALYTGTETEFIRTFGDDYLRSLRLSAQFTLPPVLADIERFGRHWRSLVPPEAEVQAALLQALATRYGASPSQAPITLESAGYGKTLVAEAFMTMYGKPLGDSAFPTTFAQQPAAEPEADPEAAALADAEAALEWMSVPAGTVLIKEGDRPDYLYFVVSGRFRVTTESGAEQRFIADSGQGQLIGEIGVLTGESRTAKVIAMRDSEVIRLPQEEVLRLTYQSPRMLLRINHILARRLRVELTNTPRVPSPRMTIAVVSISPETDIRDLTHELVRELERLGPVAHITKERAEREFPRLNSGAAPIDPFSDGELLAWLSEQESRHYFVVYEATREPGKWTDLCIRQADRVALVADAAAAPTVTPTEQRVAQLNATARLELVLLHRSSAERPQETARWLKLRSIAAHHNVVASEGSHVARLARGLSGNSIGLVFGGGGARGYVHVGAWRAFEEAGLPIDIIGGTSVGALMASGVAMDRTPDEMERLGQVFAEARLKDITLPLISFFRSREISRLLREHTANVRIEDLWRTFFCVSTSLGRAEPVIHRRGPLWLAARASSAIPGLFSPVPTADGDVLVDGGVMNNVPVDVMRALCERGPVIAINLNARAEQSDKYEFGSSVSGWQVLASRINPFAKTIQAPSIFSTLLRTTEAGSTHRMRTSGILGMADLLIAPPVDQFRLLDFGSQRELVRLGYEFTASALSTWLEQNPEFKTKFCALPA